MSSAADYYPAGLSENTPGTPWNEPIVPNRDFEVTCTQVLSKTVTVTTNNYIPVREMEYDDMGGFVNEYADTSDTNWGEEYHANDYHTPLQLIKLLKQVLEKDLSQGIIFKSPKYTEALMEECEDWSNDETEYIEN